MKKIFLLVVIGLTLLACKTDTSNRTLREYFSAFLNENKSMIAFGSADINTILNKADYSHQPKVGVLLKQPVEDLKRSLKIDVPVYYAIEGPIDSDKNPKATYIFIEVANADTLKSALTEMGYDLDKAGKMEYCMDGDVAIGIENNLAILILKKEKHDGKKLLVEAFTKASGAIPDTKVNEMLESKGDLVMSFNVSNLYATSNTDLSNLSSEKQKELKRMLEDSYVENIVKFENGAAIFETKNHFSDELNAKMFFKNDKQASILTRLGQGQPRFGLSINLDMKKMQGFMNEYTPDAMDELTKALGPEIKFALMMAGDDGLAALFNGEIGLVMMGEPNAGAGMIPDFNAYIGLNDKGKKIGEMAKELLGESFAKVTLDEHGFSAYSSETFMGAPGKKLSLPKGCEVFGTKSITAFINLEGIDWEEQDLEKEENLIKLVKYATFEYDQYGGKLVVKAKEGKENMLKQSIELLINELENEIATMAI